MDAMDILFRQSDFSAENEGLEKRVWTRLTRYNKEVTGIPINKNEITKEMFEKAMQCKDADELIALAKTAGYEITKEEAEAYMDEIEDFELNDEQLKKVAGGICWTDCPKFTHICQSDCWDLMGPGFM
jgi:predicted ribosomally synthesized peptide with nif11-like leader